MFNPDESGDTNDPGLLKVKQRMITNLSQLPAKFRTGEYTDLRKPFEYGKAKKTAQMEAMRDLARLEKEHLIRSTDQNRKSQKNDRS